MERLVDFFYFSVCLCDFWSCSFCVICKYLCLIFSVANAFTSNGFKVHTHTNTRILIIRNGYYQRFSSQMYDEKMKWNGQPNWFHYWCIAKYLHLITVTFLLICKIFLLIWSFHNLFGFSYLMIPSFYKFLTLYNLQQQKCSVACVCVIFWVIKRKPTNRNWEFNNFIEIKISQPEFQWRIKIKKENRKFEFLLKRRYNAGKQNCAHEQLLVSLAGLDGWRMKIHEGIRTTKL